MRKRRIIRSLLITLGAIGIVQAVETGFMVWAWRSRNPRALGLIKRYNKLTRPMRVRFAGRSGLVAAVHHVGRRSGTPYNTPVIAHRSVDEVIIPLPYGTDVDWLRNLLASGCAVVELDGCALDVDRPEVVTIEEIEEALPVSMRRIVRINGTRDALRMRARRSLRDGVPTGHGWAPNRSTSTRRTADPGVARTRLAARAPM